MNSFLTKYILLLILIISTVNLRGADRRNNPFPLYRSSGICFACHEDQDLYTEKNGKKISLYVNPAVYNKSAHSGTECTDCHVDYNPGEIPHTKTQTEVNCRNCHTNTASLQKNVHSDVKCSECHSKHDVRPAKEFSAGQTERCLSCHSVRMVQVYKSSVHAKKNVKCESCHQGGHSTQKIGKTDVVSVCGRCHGVHETNFKNSIHQQVLNKGNKNAPVCTDCHGSHKIIRNRLSIESQGCLKCHLDDKLFPGEQKGSAKFVAEYKTSIHAALEKNGAEAAGCIDCHGNHAIQKPDDPKSSIAKTRLPETCGKCHKDVVEKFLNSAHGKALQDKLVSAPTCVSCHSEHSIKSVNKSEAFSKLNQVEMCLKCHQEGKLPHKNYKGEEVLISNYKDSYHYVALKEGIVEAATCSDCHGAHEMKKFDDPSSTVNKKNIPKTCGQVNCHVKQYSEYSGSIHGTSVLVNNKLDAPVCTDCHGNHQILKKDEATNRISNSRGLVQLCSSCHSSVALIEKYNLPVSRAETYLGSFHGLAVSGGSKLAANCESCHGYHGIRDSKDSLSTINKKNLSKTCGKCHPGADETLFTSPIHLINPYSESPILYWVSKFYVAMILLTIGTMITHNVLDLRKKIRQNDERIEKK